MPLQRQTAKKVRIVDIVSGEWVKKEGMEPSFVITPRKESVSRARIVGTVVSKFISDDGNFASIAIDDSTAAIQAKLWKETKPINEIGIGKIVNVIGKVREYEGDIYIVPEIIKEISPDDECLLRLEILSDLRKPGEGGSGEVQEKEAAKDDESEDARKKVISAIEESGDGIKYGELVEKTGISEEKIESVVNELLGEGICYEPTPGKIKKI